MERHPRMIAEGRPGMLLFALVTISGCDSDAVDFVRDLEAARGDCTIEGLRASSEACVQMFERYSEMGSEAINTYIGGARALEEALRRTGGFSIDTTGLGRAFSDEFRSAYPDATGGWDGGWLDPSMSGSPSGQGGGYDDPTAWGPLEPGAGPAQVGMAPAARRGVLLPPEVRLRRPWLEAEPDPRFAPDDPDRTIPGYGGTRGYGEIPGYAPPGYGSPPGYVGTPEYGVPGYGVPGYGVPGYGVPGYGAPGYGVPGYAGPGYPGYGGPAYGAPGYGPRDYGYGVPPYGGVPGYGYGPPGYEGFPQGRWGQAIPGWDGDPYRDPRLDQRLAPTDRSPRRDAR